MVWDLLVVQELLILSEGQSHIWITLFQNELKLFYSLSILRSLYINTQEMVYRQVKEWWVECSPFPFKDIPRTFHWPLCLEWWKDIPGWADVLHTVCSQMLSMNDSGENMLHRTLVQRKRESCSLLSMSVLIWNRPRNAVLGGDVCKEKPGCRPQALWLQMPTQNKCGQVR